MESIMEYIERIKVPTTEVKLENIQELLKKMKRTDCQTETEEFKKQCSEILEILWLHLCVGFEEFDDQLLCSTCFNTVLIFCDDEEHYLKNILDMITQEIENKVKGMDSMKNISTTISLMYGIFQSSILVQKSLDSTLALILKNIFTLLTLMAYEYSQYTFIVFKIMTLFKKVVGTKYQEIIFNDDCNLKLLNVINHNWENPITGVRSLNKIIFHHLIIVLDKQMHEFMLRQLNGFYWNKAKYLMFSEITEQYQGDITILIFKYKLVEGLEYSLHKAGLVSAGADLYIAIVKKLKTDKEYSNILLNTILKIIKDKSIKPLENFINYWSLNTFKSFPSLIKIIFDAIEKHHYVKHKLFACLSLMQQSNRLGLLEKNFDCSLIEKVVLNGIEESNAKIRALSFDIICSSQRKFLKDQNEYDLILEFLKNNVNSDCSVLRIRMIESLQKFLSQKHMEFVNSIEKNKDCEITRNFLTFCIELQLFIKESLNYSGNYQRKIATVQVNKVMLNSFTDFPRKKQKQSKKPEITLLTFLRNKQHWLLGEKHFVMKLISLLKDPSDDIRAHVMDILLHHYPENIHKYDLLHCLASEAVTSIKSRFFYQISCGQTIFKLIINLLLVKNSTHGQFKKVEDVFEFAYETIKSVCDSKIDIVKSIDEGKQVHSYLSILCIIFEVCLGKSYKLDLSTDVITSLLEILETVSNQFAWEQESSVSSDFSKMNDMVEKIISCSNHKGSNQDNETNVSGLHQIVMNCLWLNVKASCQLSSMLIKYYSDDIHLNVSKRCLNIICHVLETSRHKGAIEAGGTALGQAIQQLTSLPEVSVTSKIPMILLKNKLNDLISETNNMASVTRRGAGLSIMIHRIVSSDMRKGKPLFHFFMQTLLETLKKLSDTQNTYEANEVNSNNEKDLPKAIYIHFLTKITIDSSLASDMLFYSANLAEIAFSNLSDSHWQIRNAALQLYGSLIPKLIGQKKKSGANEEVIATVAIDEFRTHSPKLWNYIVEQLKYSNIPCDKVQHDNNLVPTLSVIANMAPMYRFTNGKQLDNGLLPSLQTLLGSPIYVVRRLTARCLLNIYTFEVILDMLLNSTCDTENSLHGTLTLLNEFVKEYKKNDLDETIKILKKKYCNIMVSKNHSYLCREKFEQTFPEFLIGTENVIEETLLEMNTVHGMKSQGIFGWAHTRIQIYIESAQWKKLLEIVTLLIDCADFEIYCETLSQKIKNDKSIPAEILLELSIALYLKVLEKKGTIIWKILYDISQKTALLSEHFDTSLLHNYLIDNELTYGMRYMVPLAAKAFNTAEEVLTLSKIILKLSNPKISDVDMRIIAVTACNELASKFVTLLEETKINIIKAVIMFLQDEDEDIRNLSVHFYRIINMENTAKHPYICLRKILSYNFLISLVVDCPSRIQYICSDLINVIESLTINHDDEYNPFANESKNIYLEPEVIKQLLCKLKTDK